MFRSELLNFEEKVLKKYFLDSKQAMWIVDRDFKSILEVNCTAVNTFGYKKEDISLHHFEEIVPQKEQQKLLQLLENASSAKKEISLITRSGKTAYVETVVSAVLFNAENAWLFTMNDVSEKKLYRNMLEEAIDEEIDLKIKNQELKKIAFKTYHLARKPLANILGLVNVLDQSAINDQTLAEAIEFLRESSNELDELIKGIDPQLY